MNDKTLIYFRKQVKDALAKGKIKAFLGWRDVPGLPGKNRAFLANTNDEVDKLVFTSYSRENLIRLLGGKTNYLPELANNQKLGIMVKGCDFRNMQANIAENKLNREKLWVVGVNCSGTIDIERLRVSLSSDIKNINDDGKTLHVNTLDNQRVSIERADFVDVRCQRCKYPVPVHVDLMLPDDNKMKPVVDPEQFMDKYMERSFSERQEYILSQLSRCTLCFACRDSCPGCYCNENCIMDYPKLPEPFLNKSSYIPSILMYHFIHYYHLLDRCTNCGECSRSCPESIPLNIITDMLNYTQKREWNFESGTSDEAKTPLELYKIEEVLGR